MNTPRYLCSQLVRVAVSNRPATDASGLSAPEYDEQRANLEEIWRDGAVLECEEEIGVGAPVKISCGGASFAGRVTAVERHEFGWRVEMAFSPETPWSVERWEPEHLLDPEALRDKLR